MTSEQARKISKRGNMARKDAKFVEAGDFYTVAGYEWFGEGELKIPGGWTSMGLLEFLQAATCYRLGDRLERCQNRCQQGILVAEDMAERALATDEPSNHYGKARRGAWFEYVGDFQLLGRLNSPGNAYEKAKEIYRDAGDPDLAIIEQEHMRLTWYFKRVAKPTGLDLDEFYRMQHHANEGSLTQWVDYKQDHLPELIESLLSMDNWVWEDEGH